MIVTRSEPRALPKDSAFCGNCHGTGDEGLGIMPDSAGPCEACGGKGWIAIDPNAKTYTLKEFMELTLKSKEKPNAD